MNSTPRKSRNGSLVIDNAFAAKYGNFVASIVKDKHKLLDEFGYQGSSTTAKRAEYDEGIQIIWTAIMENAATFDTSKYDASNPSQVMTWIKHIIARDHISRRMRSIQKSRKDLNSFLDGERVRQGVRQPHTTAHAAADIQAPYLDPLSGEPIPAMTEVTTYSLATAASTNVAYDSNMSGHGATALTDFEDSFSGIKDLYASIEAECGTEVRTLAEALAATGGKVAPAARLMGIPTSKATALHATLKAGTTKIMSAASAA